MKGYCPSCGSPDKSWRRILAATKRVCGDDWHLIRPPQRKCRGCGELIEDGQVAMVTVTRARHVVTVASHEHHREASRANALEDREWQTGESWYGGES